MSNEWSMGNYPINIPKPSTATEALAEIRGFNHRRSADILGDALTGVETKLDAVRRVLDTYERGALRWAEPLAVPEVVYVLREALGDTTHRPINGAGFIPFGDRTCSCGSGLSVKACWELRQQ